MTDTLEITYSPIGLPPRKVVYTPREEGKGYLRTAYVRDGLSWRETGCEIIHDVTIEHGDDRLVAGETA